MKATRAIVGGEGRVEVWIQDQPLPTSQKVTQHGTAESRWSAGIKRTYRMLLVLLGQLRSRHPAFSRARVADRARVRTGVQGNRPGRNLPHTARHSVATAQCKHWLCATAQPRLGQTRRVLTPGRGIYRDRASLARGLREGKHAGAYSRVRHVEDGSVAFN